jgi:hypothetical protein
MSDQAIEKEIQAKGLNAPRVTPMMIEATISCEHIFSVGDALRALGHPTDAAFDLLTICAMKTVNGFTVIGESACASPENFDADIGATIARENAKNKIWPLEGYLLKSKLWSQQAALNPAPI